MPAYLGGGVNALGAKLISFYGNNPAQRGLPAIQGKIVLFDPETGGLQAFIDAELVTAMRTGAAGGVAARYLAREDARTLTIFGSGAQAPFQVEAAICERPIEWVHVLSRQISHAEALAASIAGRFGVSARATVDIDEAVRAADIVVTATSAHVPLFNGSLLRPGVHVTGIGSHVQDAREVDSLTLQRAKVIVDQESACLAEAGDLIQPVRAGRYDARQIYAEIGAVVAGDLPGRSDNSEITFFKSVGLAAQDLAVASLVYRRALAEGAGYQLEE